MDLERALGLLDRVAAGRVATLRVPTAVCDDPRTGTGFRQVAWLLLAEFVIGAGALGEAIARSRSGEQLSGVVWWRLLAIFAITTTLFYFVWRARRGYWWAYSRLRLFSLVFPIVAIVSSLIPGLYPTWMVEEQVLFSVVLLVVRRLLSRPYLREAYTRPS